MKIQKRIIILSAVFVAFVSIFIYLGLQNKRMNQNKILKTQPNSVRPQASKDQRFGLFNDYSIHDKQVDISQAQNLGVGHTRLMLPWYIVEPKNDQYDFRLADAVIEKNYEAGIAMTVTLMSNSSWAVKAPGGDFKNASSLPKDMSDYREFVKTTVQRYKGKVSHWQIENEVDSSRFWAGTKEDYITLLKFGSSAIRETDPNSKVVLQAFPEGLFYAVKQGDSHYIEFFDYMMKESSHYVDVIDIHQYATSDMIIMALSLVNESMEKYGYEKEIVSTEAGDFDIHLFIEQPGLKIVKDLKAVPGVEKSLIKIAQGNESLASKSGQIVKLIRDNDAAKALLDKYQADNLVKRYALSLGSGLKYVDWVCLKDNEELVSDWYQMIQCLIDSTGNKKLAYQAYMQMTEKVSGFINVQIVSTDPTVVKFIFSDKPPIYIAWSEKEIDYQLEALFKEKVSVAVTRVIAEPGQNFQDAKKEIIAPENKEKNFSIKLTETPAYLEEMASDSN